LVGCDAGEHCVIERTEQGFDTRSENTAAANDWLQSRPSWEARIATEVLFKRNFDEAAENSRTRRNQLEAWGGPFAGEFGWVLPPVLNSQTRIAVEMCPARGILRVTGYEQVDGEELPQPVTLPCDVKAAA